EVDHHVGRILKCLDALGLTEDTIVVFTSDHGEWLGEHLRYGKGYPGHDCVSRVPLLIRWPTGIADAGRRISRIVEAVDVVPTLLDCAGIPLPYHLQGASLLPFIEGRDEVPQKPALMEVRGWKSLRTERFRYVSEADGKESLYDVRKDTAGYADVAADPDYAPTLAGMRQQLLRRLIEMERPHPRISPY
ncbi:MAG: sulfatase-like hydrolase/transferase, partial [Candidatus Poribacteria bacterium]|nr:sulfatase-like hydrolase/transferase [Candidatus Poribacteria bacterium]